MDFTRGYLCLSDSKTGQKNIPLNAAALEVLAEVPRMAGSPFVFPANRGDGYYQGTPKAWNLIRQKAGIGEVRLHDLRHSFASIAVSGGASLPMVGALLGHADSATTHQYAHLLDDPLKLVTEAAGKMLSESLSGNGSRQVRSTDK